MLTVAQARPNERAKFIQQTYTHLAGAVGAFIVVEFLLFQTGIAGVLFRFVAASRFSWLAFLGAFALLGWLSRELAAKADSVETQYTGLGIYVVAEALIFAPLLYIAAFFSSPDVIPTAAILTLFLFGGLTTVAFTTRQDFTFLGGILKIAAFVALGLILCSIMFGFTLGLFFSVAMVVFASAAILYDTSNVIHHYSTHQYVAASLELFASVALLFWYVLQIVMSLSRR
ncbi:MULTISPECIES: Bax inhibitor-1 family protein [Oscillatoriophycideae]|uniref:Bax inhibitor-1 family protein n=2 Tax=Aerosakkonema funiforme TaxID=1246630 RepID=A0A926VE01_9CYAN|nr:Bax inhibitor-1 family protein [Planktothrix sp. FACHB-1355]MBD2181533.1 Bax inhibitor-1 family protein [Aerosakkonema funiforme FACHB-1375]MBD3560119.1 Bax inhibitor-1 family protein [Planktothrix sp. FACHB-1355]